MLLIWRFLRSHQLYDQQSTGIARRGNESSPLRPTVVDALHGVGASWDLRLASDLQTSLEAASMRSL
jgi:hypothetical protein